MSEQRNAHFDHELLEYIRSGKNRKAKAMLNSTLSRGSNDFGTLLHYAAMVGNVVIARQLIRLGADIDHLGHDDKTPLMLAVEHRHTETVECLLKAEANIDIVNANGQTALQMLFDLGHFPKNILRLFLKKLRADSSGIEDFYSKLRNTGLTMHEAAHFDDLRLMQFMLDNGVDVNSSGFFSLTALHAAVEQNDLRLVDWLVSKNANVDARDEDGFTPLLLSVVVPVKKAMLKLLLEHGADPNIGTYRTKESPLYALAIYEEATEDVIECMQLLFQHGAIPHNLDGSGEKIFDGALNSVSPKRAKYLIAQIVLLEKMGTPIDGDVMRCNSQTNQTKFLELVDSHKRALDDVMFKKLSLFDLLTATDYGMRKYGRDKTFAPTIKRLCRQKRLRKLYPYYCDTLMKRIGEAADAVRLEDIAIPIVCRLYGRNDDALYIAAKEIVSYLDKQNLDKLTEV